MTGTGLIEPDAEPEPVTLGWREWLALPKLGLPAIRAKIDTGARTSALHAFAMELFGPNNRPSIRFGVHPIEGDDTADVICTARVIDRREVMSSNGETEQRYVIRTPVRIGEREWPIEVTLTNRENMAYRMLLGRSALETLGARVEPARDCLNPVLDYSAYEGLKSDPRPSRPLRIALLTMAAQNHSNRRLIEAAKAAGHHIQAITTLRCYMAINTLAPSLHLDGEPLPHFDAVIPRIGAEITAYGAAITRQFELTGAYALNSANAILSARDKLLSHQILARARVPMPATAIASSPYDTEDLLELVGGPPLIVKFLQSSEGRGVLLAESSKSAKYIVSALRDLDANFLVQEFIQESSGTDIRCFVLGGKVVAAMERRAKADEFRANLHQGGTAQKVKITKDERILARRAAKLMGLECAGVDLIRSRRGTLVLEVNASPGLQGIEQISGKDIAGAIIAHIESQVRRQTVLTSEEHTAVA